MTPQAEDIRRLQPLSRELEEALNHHEFKRAERIACDLLDTVHALHIVAIKGAVRQGAYAKCYSPI